MTDSHSLPNDNRLVIIASPYAADPGHHWKYAEEIALALLQKGRRVSVIVHDSTARAPAAELAPFIRRTSPFWRAIVRSVSQIPGLAGARLSLQTLAVLMAISRETKAGDRVVLHFVDATFLVLFVWELLVQKPCVYNLMGGSEPLRLPVFGKAPAQWMKRSLTRWFLTAILRRNLIEFCAETEAVRRDWAEIVGEHVHYIPYGVSPLGIATTKAQARSDLGLSPDETVLLLFGTQREDKDFGTVIRAAHQISPPPLLLFVGRHLSGPAPSELVREIGFTNYQINNGFVSESDARLYFAACDAVVLPYAEGYEKGSAVMVEACQHLRPVIATGSGYLGNFVQQHHNGWVFRFADAADLARQMSAVAAVTPVEHVELEEKIAAAAAEHSWTRIICDYIELYARMGRNLDG
jgi:glycosyltransferase involved in cell wall biosynthesis